MSSKAFFEQRLLLVFFIILSGIIALAINAYKNNQVHENTTRQVEYTKDALDQSAEISLSLKEMESAARAFTITGDTTFLTSMSINQKPPLNNKIRFANQSNQRRFIQMDKNSLAHTKWNCKYHIVFAPKYRRQIIYGKIKRDVGIILRRLCEYKGIEIIEANACKDHIHMLVSIPPKMSVSSFVGYLKGKCSLMIFDRHAN